MFHNISGFFGLAFDTGNPVNIARKTQTTFIYPSIQRDKVPEWICQRVSFRRTGKESDLQ